MSSPLNLVMKKLIGLSLIVITLTLGSCLATKNRKAMDRVFGSEELSEIAYQRLAKSHPCTVDTVHEFINGKEVIRYDTLDFSHTDTVYNVDTQTKTIYKTVEKLVKKVDTLKVYVIDNRAERLAQNDLSKAQGQNAQLEKDNTQLKKENKSLMWWLVGVSIFSILLISGSTYLLFRK